MQRERKEPRHQRGMQLRAQLQLCYLEAGEQRLWEGVEGAAFGLRLIEVELPSKQLHAKQGEDDEEEEEEQQQGGDGLHGVQQRSHQIGQSCPMAERTERAVRAGVCDEPCDHLVQVRVLTV